MRKSKPDAEELIKEYENDCRLQGLTRDTIKKWMSKMKCFK
jgi:hypothetical protein